MSVCLPAAVSSVPRAASDVFTAGIGCSFIIRVTLCMDVSVAEKSSLFCPGVLSTARVGRLSNAALDLTADGRIRCDLRPAVRRCALLQKLF